jgi:hypothetical protein
MNVCKHCDRPILRSDPSIEMTFTVRGDGLPRTLTLWCCGEATCAVAVLGMVGVAMKVASS